MEDFSIRVVLILVGALGMGGLLLHGLWSIRKQQSGRLKEKPLADVYREREQKRDEHGFDQHGIGKVRNVNHGTEDEPSERKEPELNVEPQMTQTEMALDEPVIAEPAEAISADEDNGEVSSDVGEPEPVAEPPQMVLTLSVVASTSSTFHGAELLPQLLTLGFKFGEMDIFHRHEDSAGTGPVLFSLANMLNPGTFDVDHMESFQTPGVTLFLALPNEGDAAQSFNMMLNAAQKLAREMGGQVLDDTRSVLNNQKIRHYQERIREYERQQLLTH